MRSACSAATSLFDFFSRFLRSRGKSTSSSSVPRGSLRMSVGSIAGISSGVGASVVATSADVPAGNSPFFARFRFPFSGAAASSPAASVPRSLFPVPAGTAGPTMARIGFHRNVAAASALAANASMSQAPTAPNARSA
jgi:hypothetical protein